MGRIWDKLFHRNRYKAIVSTYDTLIRQCTEGIDIFLKQNAMYWSDTYDFKVLLHQYADDIRNLQKEYDKEEQRKQELKERSEYIKEHYRYGYGYYHYQEYLKRTTPELKKDYIPTPEQICCDSEYIEKRDNVIKSLILLKNYCPEGFASCAKAHEVDPSSSLEPPYNFLSFSLINRMSRLADEVKLHQQAHDLKRKCPNGVRLVVGADHLDDLASINQRAEEIKQAEQDYCEVIELIEHNDGMVNYVIRNTCNESNKDEVISLDAIRQVLNYKQLLNDDDIRECDFFLSLSEAQQRYVSALPSLKLQKAYILRNIISPKAVAIASAEPGDCNPVVQDFMKECKDISTEGVTFDTYFTTVARLAKDNHSIDSALALINKYRREVEQFYNIGKDAALPFSALTDVYSNKKIKQVIAQANIYRQDASKAVTISLRYPLGFRSIMSQDYVKDILKSQKEHHDTIKWIIANEDLFKEEQARIKEEEKIKRAQQIITANPFAVKRLLPDIDICFLDSEQANIVIREKTKITTLTRLLDKVATWKLAKGIPHYFFYWYYPVRFDDVTDESQRARELIWHFKDGGTHEEVAEILEEKLVSTFGTDCSSLTLVCIPASTVEDNEWRYSAFSDEVCSALKMQNAFDKIQITKEKDPSHLGGVDDAEYEFNETFFEGKYIVLFDDVLTRGHSIARFKRKLESLGAIVICAITIGRTYSDYYGDERTPHPWSGEL